MARILRANIAGTDVMHVAATCDVSISCQSKETIVGLHFGSACAIIVSSELLKRVTQDL